MTSSVSVAVDASVARAIRIHNNLHLASITFLYWDHCLTFPDELRLLWRTPPQRTARARRTTTYYFVNRYSVDIGDLLVTVVQFSAGISERWCSRINIARQALLVFNQCLVCLILGLRVYALYSLNRKLLLWLLGLAVVLIAVSVWSLIGHGGGTPELGFPGCHVAFQHIGIYTAIPWEALLLFDIVIFGLLMFHTAKKGNDERLRATPILYLLIRDGAVYFITMTLINIANIVTYYVRICFIEFQHIDQKIPQISQPLLRGSLSTMASAMSVTLTSRLMLNLYDVGNTTTSNPPSLTSATTPSAQHQQPPTTLTTMSGRGKGGKGLGKGGAKRHRKILRDNIQGITKPAIRRLARRGGVKRISGLIYEETRGVLKIFLENVIRDSVTYTEHAKRKTVTALDVVYALKRSGLGWFTAACTDHLSAPMSMYSYLSVPCNKHDRILGARPLTLSFPLLGALTRRRRRSA
ncbi:hypothetical protein HMN09_00936400 [Mycena chlorophos]|uniref:Histone H4 n=1 Tax=Mycena chlorophos TaxID=658473 RepID=A0A8H6W5Y8_MYCCL|nr:hypothetical protein HMN09_00936400 [Mycena chlorophos]